MAKSIKSHAEPVMLRWFRKSAGFTTAEAAEACGRSEEEVVAWEAGNDTPSLAQLKLLAKFYKRPTAAFYLPKPPQDFTILRDFRRLSGAHAKQYSPALRFVLRAAQNRQAWLSELLQRDKDDAHDWVGSTTIEESAQAVGARLREMLGVSLEEQRAFPSKDDAFRRWRDRCEDLGVCTFLSRGVEVKEMRGCALPDRFAPAVIVNGQDAYAARTFTLMHEMTHLLLGMDGVSDCNPSGNPRSEEQRIEAFCNAVAAETLVPAADFSARVDSFGGDAESAIAELSTLYRVSEEAIARRLLDLGFVSKDFYERKREEYAERVYSPRRDGEVKIKRHILAISNVGKRFSSVAAASFRNGDLSGIDFVEFMDMKLTHLPALEAELSPLRVQYLGKTAS